MAVNTDQHTEYTFDYAVRITLAVLQETLNIDDVNTQLLNVHIIKFKGVITIIVIN